MSEITRGMGHFSTLYLNMNDEAIHRHRLWDEFLQAWPRERLASMTLPDYIRCGSQESFTYWLEFKLADLGSIKGGTAIKFGIFERKDPAAPSERYEWKKDLGETPEEAYGRIHARILATVEAAERGDIDAVEAVELPSLVKWKVAFLYQDRENPVFPCIYGDNYLRGVTNLTRKATHAEAVKKLMAAYEGEEDIFDFCRCIWGDYDRWREYAPYGDFDPGLSERDWAELLADPKIATPKVRTLLVRLRAFGGTATCSQLAKAYGEETNFYNTAGQELGRHVREARRIPELSGADGPKYWAVPFLGRDVDPKTDGDVPGIFFWRLRPELAAALDVTDWVAEAGEPVRLDESSPAVSTIELPASIPAPRADGRYWWLNANPKEWRYTDVDLGVEFKYTVTSESGAKRRVAKYFTEARPGDVVICYQTTPYQEVVGLAVVTSAANEKDIGFTQFVRFSNPVTRDALQRTPTLVSMESLRNNQASLLKVTPDEYAAIVSLVEAEEDEAPADAPVLPASVHLPPSPCVPNAPYGEEDFLRDVWMSEGDLRKLKGLLLHKKNVILQGPPGVGKTYAAKCLAWALAGEKDDARIRSVQFHQSYSYEDFVWGFKPDADGFVGRDGVFAAFCRRAAADPEKSYFFLIDEINRGNLSKILGEALMLIEADHRGEALQLASGGEPFAVPENLYIIGMMNTADRSIALIDYALRRRFGFFTVRPAFESDGFRQYADRVKQAIALAEAAEAPEASQKAQAEESGLETSARSERCERFERLVGTIVSLNDEIRNDPTLGKGFEVGHSFLAGAPLKVSDSGAVKIDLEAFDTWFTNLIDYELLPLLEEYWYDDEAKLDHWTDRLTALVGSPWWQSR